MKKFFAVISLLSISLIHICAQTPLVNTLTPTSESKCTIHKSQGDEMTLGGYKVKSGFSLRAPLGGLISDNIPGKVVFSLKGAYGKLTFVIGPSYNSSYGASSIVTISADGKRLMDEVFFGQDAPRFYTLDVTGADELTFSIPRGSVDMCFGNVKLWKAGAAVSNPNNLLTGIPSGTVDLMKVNPPYYMRA